jgi:hypothetical protein
MARFIDFATALLFGFLIGTAIYAFTPRNEPQLDIVSFEIKPVTPGQSIRLRLRVIEHPCGRPSSGAAGFVLSRVA